jgi:hypothetical protein
VWKQLFHAVWRTFNADFKRILGNLQEHRQLIESQVGIEDYTAIIATQKLTKNMLEKQKDEETMRRREDVRQWLAAAAYEVDHALFSKARRDHPSTGVSTRTNEDVKLAATVAHTISFLGKWLLKMDTFQTWFTPEFCSNHLLWLTGIPGAGRFATTLQVFPDLLGKTVLASLIIEEARKLQNTTVAFFYCKYQDPDRNTFVAVVRGILAQLLHQLKSNNLLAYLFDEKSKSGMTTLLTDTLARKLLDVATKSHQKVYIIIDGIDECDNEQRKEIVTAFETLWDSLPPSDNDTLRCMFISQDDRAARRDFSKMVSIRITEDHIKDDIRAYAKTWSSKIGERFDLSAEKQRYMEDMITDKAEGDLDLPI